MQLYWGTGETKFGLKFGRMKYYGTMQLIILPKPTLMNHSLEFSYFAMHVIMMDLFELSLLITI